MTNADRIALIISVVAVLVTFLITVSVFENTPHIEDEVAYVWQAQAISNGYLTLPSPPNPKNFLVPFVVDLDGQRFGKYPLGWPALLAIGVRLGLRQLVNPLLAGLGVWLTYRLGKKVFGETVGLIAAGLTLTSPFFLMNSGTLLSHPFGLVLSAAFALAWIDAFGDNTYSQRKLPLIVAALSLGVLALSRPFTALAVALPFGLHGIYLLLRGNWQTRRQVVAVGAASALVAGLYFLWQYAVTGDPLTSPYTLWWPYDKVGFGPGYGVTESGHSLRLARINTKFSLWVGCRDLFGWAGYSWIFLPFGLVAVIIRRNWQGFLVGSVYASLVLIYLAYWVGAWLYGPRYYYEGLYSLTLLSGAGIALLAGWPIHPSEHWRRYSSWQRLRPLAVSTIVLLLVAMNMLFYTPARLSVMHALHGMERADLDPFQSEEAQALTPALIIVYPDIWMDYAVLLELADPFLDTPFIFVHHRGLNSDAELAEAFPDRNIFHYYPDEPYKLYTAPRPRN
jgi:4-amino-4-deoxy-L-arabinose transferase-like glycosyltransferase